MAITSFKRNEKKFLINESQYAELLPMLMQFMHLDEYCRNGQEYSIYNIYYDTDKASLIRHSLAKPYYKEKLRLRSYSIPSSINSPVFLELKKKIGGTVNKRRAILTLGEAYQFLKYGIYPLNLDYMNRQVLNEITFLLRHYDIKPACYISYQRRALFGQEDRDFRISFDHSIITRREALDLEKGCFGEELLTPGLILMEVKLSGGFPLWLANYLSAKQIFPSRFSKYGKEYTRELIKHETRYCLQAAV